MCDLTRLLSAVHQDDRQAADELLAVVYGELRKLAAHKMAGQASGHTLQPTALVHEAWLRLFGDSQPKFENRRHFFAAAAEAMRNILVDNARRKSAARRGGGQERVALDQVNLGLSTSNDQFVAVSDALDKLKLCHPMEAEIVKLRFFVGMTNEETAEVMGVSVRTANNYWAHARAWLCSEIEKSRQV